MLKSLTIAALVAAALQPVDLDDADDFGTEQTLADDDMAGLDDMAEVLDGDFDVVAL